MGKFNEIQAGYALSNDKIKDDYHWWLNGLVNLGVHDNEYPFLILSRKLHGREYKWFIPNDDNRTIDGVALRDRFAEEYDLAYDEELALEGPCSMLEMLIALSYRLLDNVDDLDGNLKLSNVFVMSQNSIFQSKSKEIQLKSIKNRPKSIL